MGWDGPVTHRQFLAWMSWMEEQWDMPTRTDYYLMQIDNSVKRVLSKRPSAIKLEHSKLVFREKKKEVPLTKEQAASISKAKWVGMMTMPVQHNTVTKEEAESSGLLNPSEYEDHEQPLGKNDNAPEPNYDIASKYNQVVVGRNRSKPQQMDEDNGKYD
jgi:hypothetical protein